MKEVYTSSQRDLQMKEKESSEVQRKKLERKKQIQRERLERKTSSVNHLSNVRETLYETLYIEKLPGPGRTAEKNYR